MAAPDEKKLPQRLIERLRALFSRPTEPEIPDLYPYKLRDPLLSPGETAFYQVLLAVVGRRVVVCPKVRLADVFSIKPTPNHQAFYDRIACRQVDFLLCERYSLKPLLAIELYDHAQPRSQRKKRDTFIDKVFKAGKLPIMHLVAQEHYSLKALALSIAPHLTMITYARDSEPIQFGIAPRCPCCGVPMVKRKVISGDYAGREYFSCRNYPNCCERLPLSKAHAYINN
ncbi:MAG: DUF2726 domain-containing protein [Chloroflexota bacterium]